MTAAATLVRRWVGLYTSGLAPDVRRARRTEIESDLWSQSEEAEGLGQTPASVATEMLIRLVLGIPADMAWRLSQRGEGAPSTRKEFPMHEPRSRAILTALGAVWAILGVAFGVLGLIAIQSHQGDRPDDVLIASAAAVAFTAGTVIALVGLLRIGRSPAQGRHMALVGSAFAGAAFVLVFSWVWPVGLLLALPLASIAVVRARQVMEPGPGPIA